MDINRLQEEMIHGMEKEIQYQNEVIQAQKGQIRHLNNQISILEEQNKKLAEAGNQLSQKLYGRHYDRWVSWDDETIRELEIAMEELPEKVRKTVREQVEVFEEVKRRCGSPAP